MRLDDLPDDLLLLVWRQAYPDGSSRRAFNRAMRKLLLLHETTATPEFGLRAVRPVLFPTLCGKTRLPMAIDRAHLPTRSVLPCLTLDAACVLNLPEFDINVLHCTDYAKQRLTPRYETSWLNGIVVLRRARKDYIDIVMDGPFLQQATVHCEVASLPVSIQLVPLSIQTVEQATYWRLW